MTQRITAILLLAHGTPDRLSEMAEYLDKVTGGRPMPQHVVEELQHRYAEIGLREELLPEGPPLTRWTLEQGRLLEAATGQKVYVGMRNWHPYIADTVARMRADGVTDITALCLAPQTSRTSVGLYKRALTTAAADSFTIRFIDGWADEPLLARAFAEELWPVWAEACALTGTRIPILFTAHSVPCRTILTTPETSRPGAPAPVPGPAPVPVPVPVPIDGIQSYGPSPTPDPYPVEAKATAANVASLLAPVGLREENWFFAFQSQGIAGAPWIGPTVEDTLKALAAAGHKGVVMQPIGFLCDHVEILYDIDISFRATAVSLGMQLWRARSLNNSPTLIRAIQHVLETQSA